MEYVCYSRSMGNILEEVKRIQIDRGLTDSQIAELLGYRQRENWTRIKGGRAPANKVFRMRAREAFLELRPPPTQTQQDGAKRGVKGILDRVLLKVKKFV